MICVVCGTNAKDGHGHTMSAEFLTAHAGGCEVREWKVYRRGNVYRVAKPGWLFWHWYREWCYGMDSTRRIYATGSRCEADSTARNLNRDDSIKIEYRRDTWHETA